MSNTMFAKQLARLGLAALVTSALVACEDAPPPAGFFLLHAVLCGRVLCCFTVASCSSTCGRASFVRWKPGEERGASWRGGVRAREQPKERERDDGPTTVVSVTCCELALRTPVFVCSVLFFWFFVVDP